MTSELSLALTVDEVELLLVALNEMPRKISDPLFTKIREQAARQLQTQEPATGAAPGAKPEVKGS